MKKGRTGMVGLFLLPGSILIVRIEWVALVLALVPLGVMSTNRVVLKYFCLSELVLCAPSLGRSAPQVSQWLPYLRITVVYRLHKRISDVKVM